jgi:hypothetical protein
MGTIKRFDVKKEVFLRPSNPRRGQPLKSQ